ncbi:hypothetical protein CEXT_727361 [Caerostris extrusa]|uniref:Uncharacterized protein n=1 Tax=Caerostris extrusa TaxID=172846 RepID=A0AAV4U3J4_CAEEX|nr:hypothetical protein CEXT_727361 [Caerostris extrusa]
MIIPLGTPTHPVRSCGKKGKKCPWSIHFGQWPRMGSRCKGVTQDCPFFLGKISQWILSDSRSVKASSMARTT